MIYEWVSSAIVGPVLVEGGVTELAGDIIGIKVTAAWADADDSV